MCDETKNVGAFVPVFVEALNPVQVVPPDNDRVAITFPPSIGDFYYVGTRRDVSDVNGYRIGTNENGQTFDRHNAGHLVAMAWWAISPPGASNISVVVVRNDELQGPEKEMEGNARPR